MKRSAVVVVGFAALLLAVPAQAGTPEVTWTTPGPGQTLTAKDFTFQATVRTGSGTLVGNVDVTVASLQGHGEQSFSQSSGNQQQVTVTRAFSLAWNGAYQATVRAAGKTSVLDNDTAQRTYTNQFNVDAPPVAPTGVSASVNSKTRVATVSWAPNPEPDLVGYEVERESPSSGWTSFAVTDKTTVTDAATTEEGGTYRYHVRALRQSAQQGALNASEYSGTASVRVSEPPATTTTTSARSSGGGSGGSGGSGGGNGETSGGGSDPDGGTGSGGGTSAGSSGSRGFGSPALATTGKVDLDDFSALLEKSRGDAGGEAEDEGTFEGKLPFKGRSGGGDGDDDAADEALGESPASDSTGNLQAMGFLAGGLLATVLLMHVLWVRSEVNRAEALEALVPEPVVSETARPAGRRRRPPCPADR